MNRPEAQTKAARVLVALGTFCVLLWCPGAPALNPPLDISQYAHTAWTYREGFMQGAVNAIAQTPDGYLWLSTQSGVVRFDGVRAVPLPLQPGQQFPSTSVEVLLAARDGTLWIGTLDGLVSWKNGLLTAYPALAGRTILTLFQDRAGTVWAGGVAEPTGTLCAIRDGSPTCYGEDGSLGTVVASLYEDGDGSLWVGASTGLWRWRPGPTRYLAAPISQGGGKMAQGDHGAGLVVAVGSVRQIVGKTVTDYPLPGVPSPLAAGSVLRDRNGGLWIGTNGHGIVHSYEGKTSAFTHNDGLSSDQVYAVFEGREASIWVATAEGLDQFRELPVTSLPVKHGLSRGDVNSVLAARDGSVWIGSSDGLYRWKDGRTTIYRSRSNPDLADDDIQSLFEDERGRIWISTFRGLAAFENGKFTPVPSVPAGAKNAITGDNHGGLWLSLFGTAQNYSLAHLAGGKILERVPWLKMGGGPGSGLVPDPDGGIWTGLLSGGIAYFRAGQQIRNLPLSEDGASARRVLDVARDRDGSIWATTNNGVSRINKERVATLTTANGLPCNTVHWIIEDNLSFYWLYTQCGLLRLARTDMDSWIADPKRVIRPIKFGVEDGIRLVPILKGLRPAVTKAPDGRIWFVNGEKVSFIDPSRVTLNTLPPPVHIEQITADGQMYEVTPGLRLPPHIRNLLIDYTALSLVVPGDVRFRVMLEGQDKGWRELVNQRHVQYTNLAPGIYRFGVRASNNSGVWNEEGATLNFVIPPAWYQTNRFRGLCAVTFVALLWAAYQSRVRQLAYQFNMRMEERVSERTRIARDLHDTLLQSFQAILPRLQAAIYQLPEGAEDSRKTLEEAADQASDAITEGRDAVQGLRLSTVEKNDLALAIRTVGEELASAETQPTPSFEVVVEGTSRNLHPILRDEVYRLAAEALRNAFRHAAAQSVEVEIRYDEKSFRLRVRDDGKGIRDEVLRGDGHEGHYGLHGMRERAELVGGKLTIWSEVDGGTEIEVIIPARRAYGQRTRRFWYFGKRSVADTHVEETIERE